MSQAPDRNETSLTTTRPAELAQPINVASYAVGTEEAHALPLREYWDIIVRRRWTIVAVFLVVVVSAAIGTLKQRPMYRAKAIVQIDKENPNLLSFKDFIGIDSGDESYLETAYKNLTSETLARRVIDKLQLDKVPEFTAGSGKIPAGVNSKDLNDEIWVDPKMQRVIDTFFQRLTINPVRRSRWVEIMFDSYDPVLCARVVNALAANYVQLNLEAKWDATYKASDMISQQLIGLKVKLEKSEEELQRYAKQSSILLIDEKQSITSQKLKQLQEELTRAEADLFQKEAIYNRVKSGDVGAVPGMLDNKLYQELSARLVDLQRQYAELSAKFEPEYPRAVQVKKQMDELEAAMGRERVALARHVTDEHQSAQDRAKLLREAVVAQTREFNDIGEKSIQYNILKREVDTNRQLYEGLLQRLKEAGVSAGMKASNIRVVDKGKVPLKPTKPQIMLNMALALLAGLALGFSMAFLQEFLDDSLKTPDDVRRQIGLPTLGVIPSTVSKGRVGYGYGYSYGYGYGYGYGSGAVEKQKQVGGDGGASEKEAVARLISPHMNSAQSEAYRSLRTAILLSTPGKPPRVIVLTSAQPAEGKTKTAVNLSIILAQLGSRVLLVDSDMRRPRTATVLKLPASSTGLSTYLVGQSGFEESIVESHIPNLYVVPCGPIPPNPAELVASGMMKQLLAEAAAKFDYVILDSPPVLHVTDGRVLAAQADAVMLVVWGGVTSRTLVIQARDLLGQVNANMIGVVLNNVDLSASSYYGRYRYSRYYSGREEPETQEVEAAG
jgi:capsular exopolysaccharide synthesis family protein